ncbi:hypothetical protein GTW98_18895 [Streptomyces sp. SID8375]|uniref:hypothetical protein n=1 Tax=unclassified Streptomyces TaxID=2593676 RepID=UPI00035C8ADD|nr:MULTISPECIES: hypothetical protein [unclassified Streptomyces]MYX08845.1 hypothetical protein [Streptomyces sp. SID8375]
MSLIDGGAPSPDWVALDMEAMLRECDGTIASKDDELRRLEEVIEALRDKMANATEERQQAILARQKAKHVLDKLHAAIEEATGLRTSRGRSPSRLRIVPPAPDSSAERLADIKPVAAELAPIRIAGRRSIAAMQVIGGDPRRSWSAGEVGRLLEGEVKGADRRTRCLLDSLHKQSVLEKVYSSDGKRTYYRLAAEWEAA